MTRVETKDLVLQALTRGPMTVAQLSARTGRDVWKVVQALTAAGVLVASPSEAGAVYRLAQKARTA